MPEIESARTARRCASALSNVLPILWALSSTGCLVTKDFAVEKESKGDQPESSATAPVQAVCEEDARSCSGRDLLHCVSGRWQVGKRCGAGETCSAPLGRCTRCEPLDEHRCKEGRLERCREDGSGFELLEDCVAAGETCDVELSYDRCLDCLGTDRRCAGRVLQRCSGGQFVDAGPCDLGQCFIVDGHNDHCPECPEPGREACGVGKRVVCSDALELEELEACPRGCAFDGGVTHCL